MTEQHEIVRPLEREVFPGQSFLGTTALLLGTGLLFLAVVETTYGLPFSMPRFWYVNQSLWCFFGIVFIVIGSLLLRKRVNDSGAWKPSRPGVRFGRVVLYTRPECDLCDQARQTLLKHAAYLPEIEEADIDTDPKLLERFAECIPVVEVDGKVRFRGRVNIGLLRQLIEGTPPNP